MHKKNEIHDEFTDFFEIFDVLKFCRLTSDIWEKT